MKIKVCGMRESQNIIDLGSHSTPDLIGFIYYNLSPRFVGFDFFPNLYEIALNAATVGVFVNHPIEEVIKIAKKGQLDYVQLHGNEDLKYLEQVKKRGIRVIKSIAVKEQLKVEELKNIEPLVDYFLFDTASSQYGGTGKKFNWQSLQDYTLSTPFFLSGGIGPEDVNSIIKLNHPLLFGIDINSKFEIRPGLKNIPIVNNFIKEIRNEFSISS